MTEVETCSSDMVVLILEYKSRIVSNLKSGRTCKAR